MLLVVKNVEFCSSFFAIARQAESLKIIWKRSSKPRILKTGYVHDHAHVHVDDQRFRDRGRGRKRDRSRGLRRLYIPTESLETEFAMNNLG